MKLSAVLICRNEEALIGRCLDSLKEVDEVVVYDTGSVDGTLGLLEARAKSDPRLVVARGVWEQDFSKARNAALGLATGDWVLSIDCDEVLAPGSAKRVRQRLEQEQNLPNPRQSFRVRMESEKFPGHIHEPVRLFQRAPHIRWEGRIHEAVNVDSGFVLTGAKIIYGYSPAHDLDPDRNLNILLSEYREAAGGLVSPRTLYYLGKEYWERSDFEKAALYFEERVQQEGSVPEKSDAWLLLARCYWALHKGEQAREACMCAILRNPEFKEAFLAMSEMVWEHQASTWRRFAAVCDNTGVLFVRTP